MQTYRRHPPLESLMVVKGKLGGHGGKPVVMGVNLGLYGYLCAPSAPYFPMGMGWSLSFARGIHYQHATRIAATSAAVLVACRLRTARSKLRPLFSGEKHAGKSVAENLQGHSSLIPNASPAPCPRLTRVLHISSTQAAHIQPRGHAYPAQANQLL